MTPNMPLQGVDDAAVGDGDDLAVRREVVDARQRGRATRSRSDVVGLPARRRRRSAFGCVAPSAAGAFPKLACRSAGGGIEVAGPVALDLRAGEPGPLAGVALAEVRARARAGPRRARRR